MRQLAIAGSILLVGLLGAEPAASARDRYAAGRVTAEPADAAPGLTPTGAGSWPIPPVVNDRTRALMPRQVSPSEVSQPKVLQPLRITPRRAPMADLVLAAARRHGVPAALAYGVASVESGFNPRARSRSGAIGLMQILPATARGLGCRGSMTNPAANADCGARYLASILGDQGGDIRRTAALYSEGRFATRVTRGGSRYAALVMAHGRRRPA